MNFLPIVERELRVAVRRRSTYWWRSGAAGLAFIIWLWIFGTVSRWQSASQIGHSLFSTLSFLSFFFCLLAGIWITSDCLSMEKREGTLGLLFLTDLKGYDVVFGKLTATSVNAFYGLLAMLPVLAVPLLLGGVTNAEFWRVALALANTLLLSLSGGTFGSVLSRV